MESYRGFRRAAAADTMESYRRLRGALSHSSKGRLLMRDGIFLLNRRGLRHGKFWPMRRQMRIRYWGKVLMAQKGGARIERRVWFIWSGIRSLCGSAGKRRVESEE